METESRIPINKLVIGLCLLAVGIGAFLGAIGALEVRGIGRFWPVILIAIGLSGQIEAIRRRKNDGSYMILAIGCWMLVGTFRLFGLHIGNAMPVGIVVVGCALVLHAIIDRPSPAKASGSKEENDHV
jgi:hypothetical protein